MSEWDFSDTFVTFDSLAYFFDGTGPLIGLGSVRQWVSSLNSNMTFATNAQVSFAESTVAGSAIWVTGTYSHAITSGSTVTDTVGNTYVALDSVADTGAGNRWLVSFLCVNSYPLVGSNASPTPDVITFSIAGTTFVGVAAFEVYGVTGLLGHSANWQASLTGTQTISSGNVTAGGGPAFLLATSIATTINGAGPTWIPTAGAGGYSVGGSWYQLNAAPVSGGRVGAWEARTVNNFGTAPILLTTPTTASSDNFLTVGLAFSLGSFAFPFRRKYRHVVTTYYPR